MSEEKIKNTINDNLNEIYHEPVLKMKNEQFTIQDFIFSNIIKHINEKEKFMLGPEKTKAARFISKNYRDVYRLLNKLIKINDIEEFE